MRPSRIFVYIEPSIGYYARYSGKTRTHAFRCSEHMEPAWVEMLRTAPETWDEPVEPEAA